MKLFFIRQKSTGLYIQQAYGPKGKGGSWLEPGSEDDARPFTRIRAATSFLSQWLKGAVEYNERDDENVYHPVPPRRAEDFEIIEKEIDLAASSQITHSTLSPVPAQHVPHRR